jgi:glucose/mannose-6-phosphate isomerase
VTAGLALDDRAVLEQPGVRTMLALAASLGEQLRAGYAGGVSVAALPSGEGVRAVVLCGMGGSGVGGDMVRSLLASRLPVPVVVVKGQTLPELCGRDTLVIASSFSGDTAETVTAYEQAVARGCRVVAVSSGGALAALAEADQVPHARLPGDIPMPRAALGHLAGVPFGILEATGLVAPLTEEVDATARLLEGLAHRLGPDVDMVSNEAKQVAAWIGGRVPVFWGTEGPAEAVAGRWKTQVNENAKGPAWWAVLPELDHNEVEGWTEGTGQGHAAVVLRHGGEPPGMRARVEATIEAVRPSGLEVRQVHASGSGPMEWMFSLVMLGDFATTYLGVLRGRDPMPIPILTGLKRRLAEVTSVPRAE